MCGKRSYGLMQPSGCKAIYPSGQLGLRLELFCALHLKFYAFEKKNVLFRSEARRARPSQFPHVNELKVECLLTLAIWSYGHEAEEYIFLNLPFPSNPKENSSIRCILSTPEQNLLLRIIGCTIRAIGCTPKHFTTL